MPDTAPPHKVSYVPLFVIAAFIAIVILLNMYGGKPAETRGQMEYRLMEQEAADAQSRGDDDGAEWYHRKAKKLLDHPE